jgi:purine-binding chemotaxis protein CheW
MMDAAIAGGGLPLAGEDEQSYFTVYVGGEIFGLPVENTHTIFRVASFTPVPLSTNDIAGLVNLRGKIVTAVSLRRRLRMPVDQQINNALAIGIEHRGENFALIVDEVGDVVAVQTRDVEPPLPTLGERWQRAVTGVVRRDEGLLVVISAVQLLKSPVTV